MTAVPRPPEAMLKRPVVMTAESSPVKKIKVEDPKVELVAEATAGNVSVSLEHCEYGEALLWRALFETNKILNISSYFMNKNFILKVSR